MNDRIRSEVPTRNTSLGGAGPPIAVSSYAVGKTLEDQFLAVLHYINSKGGA